MQDPRMAKMMGAIKALPPTVNPYTVLKGMLPPLDMPDWFYKVLNANYVIAGLGLLACLITIGGRLIGKRFWLFQVKDSSCGPIILPNTALLLSIFSGIYFFSSLMRSYFFVYVYRDKHDPLLGWVWQTVILVQIMLCLWTQAWGCTGAAVLLFEPKSRNLRYVGPIVSGVFILGYLLSLSLLPGIQGYYIAQMDGLFDNWLEFQKVLSPSEQNWQPGQALVPDPAWTSILARTFATLNKAMPWQRIALYLYGSLLVTQLVLVALPSAFFYIKTLRKQIACTKEISSREPQLHSTIRNYNLLIAETLVVLVLSVCYIIAAFWMGSNAGLVVADPHFTSVSITILLLPFGVIAMAISVMLAYYTISQLRTNRSSASSRPLIGSGMSNQSKPRPQHVSLPLRSMQNHSETDLPDWDKNEVVFEKRL